jgi:hypothetical protein
MYIYTHTSQHIFYGRGEEGESNTHLEQGSARDRIVKGDRTARPRDDFPNVHLERRVPLEVSPHLGEMPIETANLVGQTSRDAEAQFFLYRHRRRAVFLGRHDVVGTVHDGPALVYGVAARVRRCRSREYRRRRRRRR